MVSVCKSDLVHQQLHKTMVGSCRHQRVCLSSCVDDSYQLAITVQAFQLTCFFYMYICGILFIIQFPIGHNKCVHMCNWWQVSFLHFRRLPLFDVLGDGGVGYCSNIMLYAILQLFYSVIDHYYFVIKLISKALKQWVMVLQSGYHLFAPKINCYSGQNKHLRKVTWHFEGNKSLREPFRGCCSPFLFSLFNWCFLI